MSSGSSSLQFILSLVDRVSGPLARIHARLHAMGLEQMKLFSQNFHSYGNAAAATARKVALITAALTAAIAATAALVSAMLPMMAMAGVSLGVAVGTANTAGVARESAQIQQKTGIDTNTIQQYRQAGRMVGMEAGFGQVGDVGKVFTEIHAKLAAPDEAMAKAMKQVKIPLAEIKGMKPDEFLQRVVTQTEKLGMTDVQKSAILEELAGDASKLLPLLGKNAAALQRFQAQSAKVGAIITPEQAELMKITNTEWALMKTGVEGYGNILSTVGGNFMKLFGPEINQWFADSADGMRQWAADSVKELQRLHAVFKRGGMQGIYEDLFPNFSAFTGRVGAFMTGFNASFSSPFMATVREVWGDVSAVLGNTAGGAQGLGAAIGGAILPVFARMMEVIGSTVLWLEYNWDIVKQMFSWSPLGLIMDNWGAISDALQPVMDTFSDLATRLGMIAPGFNAAGNSGGTLMGILTALAGILFLNKIAFGAVYHVVKLYRGIMILLRATTMLYTATVWALQAAMIALRAVSLVGFLIAMGGAMAAASIGTWSMAGAMAVLTSPITLVIAGLAALAAGAYYLYTNWASVKAYLGETAWGQMLLTAIGWVTSPLQTFNAAVTYLSGLWTSTKASLAETTWGQAILTAINALFSPFEMFKSAVDAAKAVWNGIKASLADTGWGQAILGTINSILGAIDRFKAGWASMKSAASEQISGGWSSIKAAVGFGGESSPVAGAPRALGGTVLPGHFHRVAERGPELLQTMGQTYLMTGGMAGNIIPFPTQMAREKSSLASLSSEATPLNVRDFFGSDGKRGSNNESARSGKTIHIGAVHIHTNNKIDPYELEQQLGMLG